VNASACDAGPGLGNGRRAGVQRIQLDPHGLPARRDLHALRVACTAGGDMWEAARKPVERRTPDAVANVCLSVATAAPLAMQDVLGRLAGDSDPDVRELAGQWLHV